MGEFVLLFRVYFLGFVSSKIVIVLNAIFLFFYSDDDFIAPEDDASFTGEDPAEAGFDPKPMKLPTVSYAWSQNGKIDRVSQAIVLPSGLATKSARGEDTVKGSVAPNQMGTRLQVDMAQSIMFNPL